MSDYDDWTKGDQDLIPVLQVGGVANLQDGTVMAFVGYDPDAKCNIFTWDQEHNKWHIKRSERKDGWANHRGPLHHGQYRPTDIKALKKTEKDCKTYNGTKFDGIVGRDGALPTLGFDTYKETIRKHCVENDMHHVFVY